MADKPCLTPNCKVFAKWRGLCSKCYGQAKKLIEKKLTDWDELITMGLALPNVGELFTAEFHKRKQQRPVPHICPHCEHAVCGRNDDGGALVCELCNGPL